MSNTPNSTTADLLREAIEFFDFAMATAIWDEVPPEWQNWFEQAEAEISRLAGQGGVPVRELIVLSGGRNYVSVHDQHCCQKHGCKYGDLNCPVMHGTEHGVECESCSDEQMAKDQKVLAAAHGRTVLDTKADT